MNRSRVLCILLPLFSLLAGCGSRRSGPPAIGEAYVGPATLNIRKDLGLHQPTVATVKHGERLDIVGRRRAFVQVRTESGAIGWVDGRQLFTTEQMAELRSVADRAAALPSQGQASIQEALNVHTHPNRQSPSFRQLKTGERVDVVAHRLEPRVPFRPDRPVQSLPPSAPMEDWSLVRTADGKAGWVLFRLLFMAIPDEVAQYAEGHRITSYFSLGEVHDGDAVKHNWLWTTIARGLEPYEFDGFRVFVWSLRRHRYETAYIERNLRGYYPVELHPQQGGAPSFSLIIEDKDGVRSKRTYAFQGYRVRLIATEPWNPGSDAPERIAGAEPPFQEQDQRSFFGRLWDKIKGIFGR